MATAPKSYRPVQRKLPGTQRYADGFYDSKAWRTASKWQRIREPLCRSCGEPATNVDHIIPLAQGGEPFAESNLQSLCTACHADKTRGENRNRGYMA